MTTALLAAAALAVAQFACAILAWDFGVRWLADRASTRIQENVLGETTARLDTNEAVVKKLAEDWKKKFDQLERDWKALEERAKSQFSGAVAQVESQQRKGFGR